MNRRRFSALLILLAIFPAEPTAAQEPPTKLRIATYNISFYRHQPEQLLRDLQSGQDAKARKIAEVIQRIRPDVILLNEIDYDPAGQVLAEFQRKYLSVGQSELEPIKFRHTFTAPVNTGQPSGLDLNQNGRPGEPDDAWGFGRYPGQYGMAVLSRFPIDMDAVRTFQNFHWSAMPGAKRPVDPQTGKLFYPDEQGDGVRSLLARAGRSGRGGGAGDRSSRGMGGDCAVKRFSRLCHICATLRARSWHKRAARFGWPHSTRVLVGQGWPTAGAN